MRFGVWEIVIIVLLIVILFGHNKIPGMMKNLADGLNVFKKELPTTTFQLRDLIKNPHDVAPVFQALRIAVNDEMGQIKFALNTVRNLLRPGGRCVCVTFHSVEDRIVKNTFRQWTNVSGDPRLPSVSKSEYKLLKVYTPSDTELENNPRARSAHLRGVEKL